MKKRFLINWKIRNKLLLIYFFCVLLPIILTDAIILHTVNNNYEAERRKEIQFLMERIEYNLGETVKNCFVFTNNLYTDRLLDGFLNRKYANKVEYYEEYYQLLSYNNLSYNYNNGVLSKIQLYTDNPTILNGGKIASLEDAKQEEWYQLFIENGEEIMLCTYFDDTKRYATGSGTVRTISIIRELDNFGKTDVTKLLKIDINYSMMWRDVLNEKTDAEIYVRNEEFILFSNLPDEGSMRAFRPADSIELSKDAMSQKFINGRQEWEIVVIPDNANFWTVIKGAPWLILLVLLNIILPSILILVVGKSISRRLTLVSTHMDKVKREEFEEIEGVSGEDEIGDLIHSYNLMVRKISNLIQVVFKGQAEKQALELSTKQAELKAIQSQVNPHFLFNTLESIRMRSLIKGEEETADVIGELAILFRKSMTWGSNYVTIEEEVSCISNYIKVQQYRFGDKIKYQLSVTEDCKGYLVPKLAISGFVENAFVHGIEASAEDGFVSLKVTKDEDNLVIKVSDNGKGIEPKRLEELRWMLANADTSMLNTAKSTGILNAFLRLKMQCEGELNVYIDSEPEHGTKITIQLPLRRLSDSDRTNAGNEGGEAK